MQRAVQTKKPGTQRRPAGVGAAPKQRAARPHTPAQSIQKRMGNRAALLLVAKPANARPAQLQKDAAKKAPATQSIETSPAATSSAPQTGKPAAPTAAPASTDTSAAAEAPAAPNAQTELAPLIAAVRNRAKKTQRHDPPGKAVASAQAAAKIPAIEQNRAAAEQTVAHLDAASPEEVRRNDFKAKLNAAILEATRKPETEAQAEQVMQNGATDASAALSQQLDAQRNAAAGSIQAAIAAPEATASTQQVPKGAGLQAEAAGPPPKPVDASPVVPASLTPKQLDYTAHQAPSQQLMAEHNITRETLNTANDPAFAPTLEARAAATQHQAGAPAAYRASEGEIQAEAQTSATQQLAQNLAGMQSVREGQLGNVFANQQTTQSKDAAERLRITTAITGIKVKTRDEVSTILASMETEVATAFEAGLKRAETAYEAAFDEAKGGVGNWLTHWGDAWQELIEESLVTARAVYTTEVDAAIDEVADLVDAKLQAAEQRVDAGLKEVQTFVAGLDASVQQFGEEALDAVSADFEKMGGEINQRRDSLIDSLTTQYKASYDHMSAKETELREANKSLWQRAYNATVGLAKQIFAFKTMLLNVLGEAGAVIKDIIAHPIRFLGNLVSAVGLGLKNFIANLGTHLQKGLVAWLLGALEGAGLTLPDKLDLQGVISLVLQVLGVTYNNFRARAVRIVGEPAVAAIERTAEVFTIILSEGAGGLWRLLKVRLSNLKSMVIDAITGYIKTEVITAGIKWIIGLLNPAAAFFKACKAIYDIVTFFVTRGRQVAGLVSAITGSIAAIAAGSLGAAASRVENALVKTIPVAIGFLAGLIGIGDPSKPVSKFIDNAQAPVNKALDWLILKAATTAKGIKKAASNILNSPKVKAGLIAIEQAESKYASNGAISRSDAEKVADEVKQKHKVFKSLTVVDGGKRWDYDYVVNPPGHEEGLEKAEEGLPERAVEPRVNNDPRSFKYGSPPRIPKHGKKKQGRANPEPKDPLHVLQHNSVWLDSKTSDRRIGVDRENMEFVVFDQTLVDPDGIRVFHGHSRLWSELHQKMQSVLIKAGLIRRRGRF